MTNFILAAVLVIATIAFAPFSRANNNRMLPGDAYFLTRLTQEDIESLVAQNEGPFVFEYSSLDTYGMTFCGYAGYEFALFDSVGKAFIENLAAAYVEIRQRQPRLLEEQRENGETTLVERNGIKVFFYRSDFDLDHHQIALRYNEDWADEAISFGHQRSHLRLCCMLKHPQAVMTSWRDAKSVKPFDLICPTNKTTGKDDAPFSPHSQPAPVRIRGQVKAVIALRESLEDYFMPSRDEYLPLHIVDANGHREITRKDGKWVPSEELGDTPF